MRALIVLVVAVVLGGCTQKYGDMTIMSTKNLAIDRIDRLERGPMATGEDIAHIILVVPTQWSVNIDDAVEAAIDSVPGAVAMTDVSIKMRFFYLFYGQTGWVVEGTTLIDPDLAAGGRR